MDATARASFSGRARALIAAAILAPSSHNTQPWLFRLRADRIDLLADRSRALPANDPAHRELTLSCACALFNLRVAAVQAGLPLAVTQLPDDTNPDLLASARIGIDHGLEPHAARLFEALARRRTCRRSFAVKPVPPDVVHELAANAAAEGAWLHILDESQRPLVTALIEQGDRRQWADPAWRDELAAWMHSRRRGDGLVLPATLVPAARYFIRRFDIGRHVGEADVRLAENAPVLAVLGTAGDTPAHWLAAGQALQRVLLSAAARGLQASFLNQPVQVAALRQELQRRLGNPGLAQGVLRLGYPRKDLPASPRRPLDVVIVAG